MSNYTEDTLTHLNNGHEEVQAKFRDLRLRYIARAYKAPRSHEYAIHGFCRRLGTLARAIDIVYGVLPPELTEIPEQSDVADATIAIQSFVLNTFGCLDNLAWIFVCEKGVKNKKGAELSPKEIGFDKEQVRKACSSPFVAYLDSRKDWFVHLKDFRDALAHRIPLYIPPFMIPAANLEAYNRLEHESDEALRRFEPDEYDSLQAQQKLLGVYQPIVTHSVTETRRRVLFHAQLIADFNTVDEFGRQLLEELDR